MKLKYLGPHDALDIVGVPDPVALGEEFDVDTALGEQLLQQPTSFAPADEEAQAYLASLSDEEVAQIIGIPLERLGEVTVDATPIVDPANLEASTIPELKDFARDNNIELGDASLKADVIAAIAAALLPASSVVVGENGPELVDLPPGTSIRPSETETPSGDSAGDKTDPEGA